MESKMKYIMGVLLLVLGIMIVGLAAVMGSQNLRVQVTGSGDPNAICPTVYDPVCGTDGKTYGNECEARYRYGTEVAHEEACTAAVTPTPTPEVHCAPPLCSANQTLICPPTARNGCGCYCGVATQTTPAPTPSGANCIAQYNPVCGVDGRTYSNSCVAQEQHKVGVKHPGECQPSPKPEVQCAPPLCSADSTLICPSTARNGCGCYCGAKNGQAIVSTAPATTGGTDGEVFLPVSNVATASPALEPVNATVAPDAFTTVSPLPQPRAQAIWQDIRATVDRGILFIRETLAELFS